MLSLPTHMISLPVLVYMCCTIVVLAFSSLEVHFVFILLYMSVVVLVDHGYYVY